MANTIPEFILASHKFIDTVAKQSTAAPVSRRVNVGEVVASFLVTPVRTSDGGRGMYVEARSVGRDGRATVRHVTATSKDGFAWDGFLLKGSVYFALYRGNVGVFQQFKFIDSSIRPLGWVKKTSVDRPLLPNINARFNANGMNGEAIMKAFGQLF